MVCQGIGHVGRSHRDCYGDVSDKKLAIVDVLVFNVFPVVLLHYCLEVDSLNG